jgi:hypothetical protein
MADRITYAGLDVHKESIVVAVASGGLTAGSAFALAAQPMASHALAKIRESVLDITNQTEQLVLSRQQQPHPRGDDRAQITRARQAAEALFTSKPPPVSTASSPGTADAARPVDPQTAGATDTMREIPRSQFPFRPLGCGCPFGWHCRQRESTTGGHGAFGFVPLREQRGWGTTFRRGGCCTRTRERRTHCKVPARRGRLSSLRDNPVYCVEGS